MSSGLNSVSAIAVLDLRQVLIALGVLQEDAVVAAGLSDAQLLDASQAHLPIQEQRVAETHFLRLWKLAARHSALPHIGILIGQHYCVEARGLLANWLFQCDTLQQSLDAFIKHSPLMNPSERWLVSEEHPSHLRLIVAFDSDKGYPRAAIERSLAALLVWCQELTGEPVPVQAITLAEAKPDYHQALVAYFGDKIEYGHEHNSIVIPRPYLAQKVITRNPYLQSMMQEKAGAALATLQQADDPVARIQVIVSQNLATVPDINTLSQQLNISRATLYRQLKSRGTSYSAIVTEVQQQQAKQWLAEGKAINAISIDLGFADTSAFYKAFKRWYGMTPVEFQSDLGEQ